MDAGAEPGGAAHGPAGIASGAEPERDAGRAERTRLEPNPVGREVGPDVLDLAARPERQQQLGAFVETIAARDRIGLLAEAGQLAAGVDAETEADDEAPADPESRSRAIVSRASFAGRRRVIGVTIVPSRMRSVAVAIAASEIHASPMCVVSVTGRRR